MSSSTTTTSQTDVTTDPVVAYSRALYDYTFRLWKESKRAEEESLQKEKEGTEKHVENPAYKPTSQSR